MSKYQAWKQFEREIVGKLKGAGLSFVRRTWSEQFAEGSGIDIRGGGFAFQLKYGKKPNLVGAWHEANNAMEKEERAIGVARYVVKGKRARTLVCVDWDTFEWLLKKRYER